jgi:hypothetical protein
VAEKRGTFELASVAEKEQNGKMYFGRLVSQNTESFRETRGLSHHSAPTACQDG